MQDKLTSSSDILFANILNNILTGNIVHQQYTYISSSSFFSVVVTLVCTMTVTASALTANVVFLCRTKCIFQRQSSVVANVSGKVGPTFPRASVNSHCGFKLSPSYFFTVNV